MIKSFSHHGLEEFFVNGSRKGIQAKHAQKLEDVLDLINAADDVFDLDFPGAKLHPLKGKSKGFWAISISGNWRIIFRFQTGDAFEVDYLDYH